MNAQQMPLRLDRTEFLDQHLRTRKEWDKVVRGWTVYIQDKKNDAESDSFLRRGTAYLQNDDFDRGYKGLKAACIGQQGRLCRAGRIAEGTGHGFQGPAATRDCRCASVRGAGIFVLFATIRECQ